MNANDAIPDTQALRKFLLGQLSRDEAEVIERYLEAHPEAAGTLIGLKADDTFTASLRGIPNPPTDDPPEVAALIDKLARLQRAAAAGPTLETICPSPDADTPSTGPVAGSGDFGRLGDYRLLEQLGAGGMGMVYKAEDTRLRRSVALKVMKPDIARNPTARERFLREARAAARLKSDHVVSVYQVGEDRDVAYLAMEYLEGMSLEDWLNRGGTPTVEQAARIGRQIALGLADAHACGLVHRDVKPGNVWLEGKAEVRRMKDEQAGLSDSSLILHPSSFRVKLLDFGLARSVAEDLHLTSSDMILGTPAYLARCSTGC
jgi:tRNA A-37 threonylcarbamoyl transferase component Bud32